MLAAGLQDKPSAAALLDLVAGKKPKEWTCAGWGEVGKRKMDEGAWLAEFGKPRNLANQRRPFESVLTPRTPR